MNPTEKWSYFHDWEPQWRTSAKQSLKSFWKKFYRSSTGLVYREDRIEVAFQTEKHLMSWMAKRDAQPLNNLNKLERYSAKPGLLELRSIVSWWMDPAPQTRFPLLSAMATDMFSLPAMSSESERVFSGTKHTISLNPETIQALECMKSWFTAGPFTKEDLKNVPIAPCPVFSW